MRLLSRAICREVALSAFFGTVLFTFVLFLQRVGRFFEILVRASAPPKTVAHLFVLAIPFTLTFAVPMGLLVGVLISLSRMSTDGEITAMRAAGVPSRRVIAPVMTCAVFATLVAAASSLWLTPYATWKTSKMLNDLAAASLTADVQARVFDENFPNRIVYIGDIIPGALTRWRNVFIADTTPPEEQKKTDHDRGDGPQITTASDAIAIPDLKRVPPAIQLSLQEGVNYDVGKDITDYYATGFAKVDKILEATKPNEVHTRGYTELDTIPLYRLAYHDRTLDHDSVIQARVELHQRLALPPACLLLALIGIPLGVSSRKGGKSTAFVVTVALAFIYWMGLLAANGLAKDQRLPVPIAMWIPNTVFALVEEHWRQGCCVIYEGLFTMNHTRGPLLARAVGPENFCVVKLTGTLQECLTRVDQRRALKGEGKLADRHNAANAMKNLSGTYKRAANYASKMKFLGCCVYAYSSSEAPDRIVELLRGD